MKASELRLGNWVNNNPRDGVITVFSNDKCVIRHKAGIDRAFIEELEPIPLTEEWLLKFNMELTDGFSSSRKLYLNNYENDISKITYSPKEGLLRLSNGDTKGTMLIPHIKYVNQLQNLYFALTGEELTIKVD
jgi:hypothetical protein